jgi:hypothetical protein
MKSGALAAIRDKFRAVRVVGLGHGNPVQSGQPGHAIEPDILVRFVLVSDDQWDFHPVG